MKTSHHISIEIDAIFGSSFQEEAAIHALEPLMKAWREFWQEKHSQSRIEYRIIKVEAEQASDQ